MDSRRSPPDDVPSPAGGGGLGVALVGLLVLVSGAPAIVYQLLWQRALYAIYGIHVEAVAVVVAAFLLGLGIGGSVGGAVSRRARRPLLLFALAELAIGAYGFWSLAVFDRVGAATLQAGPVATAAVTFALVAVPTVLMGATLPLLVAHLVRRSRNVGRSVGLLLFVNTVGSAAACLVGAFFLFETFGAAASVRIAAAVNLSVGALALAWAAIDRRATTAAASAPAARPGRGPTAGVLALAFAGGAVSLSHEIVWFRVYSFATGGLAAGFALVLGMFLAGLAVGALVVRGACRDDVERGAAWATFARLVAAAAVAGFLLVPLVSWLAPVVHVALTLPAVLIGAALLGVQLPLLGHLGVAADGAAGAGVGRIVLANVLGAVAGSLATGFVLMEHLPLSGIVLLLAGVGLAVAAAVRFATATEVRSRRRGVLASAATLLLLLAARPVLFDGFWDRLLFTRHVGGHPPLERIVEGRGGVIAVTGDGDVYGGGMYDGALSTDLVDDPNGIVRAFALPALHPAPRDVLLIGLSSGSWARVIAAFDGVERLTVVEIDRGYLRLIAERDFAASLLDARGVAIEVDDGRRWLARHPERRFDAIVMNTTFHWRAHVSRLLSVEFLEEARRHLRPGGFLYYNTTDSPRAQATAAAVFPHVFRFRNFVAASDHPLVPDATRLRAALERTALDGRRLLDADDPVAAARVGAIVREFEAAEGDRALRARTASRRPITDDDMGSEWSHEPDR
ncbi:MAG: fused MFS/spermidine synthase [Planctomycetota bacterium JB042]